MFTNFFYKQVFIFLFFNFFVLFKLSNCKLHYIGIDGKQETGGKWICVEKDLQLKKNDFKLNLNGDSFNLSYYTYNFPYPNKQSGNGKYVYFNSKGEISFLWPINKEETIREETLSDKDTQYINREDIKKYCYLAVPNDSPKELTYYIEASLLSIFKTKLNSWQNGGHSGDSDIFDNDFKPSILRYTSDKYSMFYTIYDENVNNYYTVFENPDFYNIFYYFKNYQNVKEDLEDCDETLNKTKNELKREISSINKFLESTNLVEAFHKFRIGYIKGHSKQRGYNNQVLSGATYSYMLSALYSNVYSLPKSDENIETLIKILEILQNDEKNKVHEAVCPQEKTLNAKIQKLEKENEDARIVNNQLNSTINSNEIKNKNTISEQENEIITLKIENQKLKEQLKSNITSLNGEISILKKQLNGNITLLNGEISILKKQLNGNITFLNEEISSLNSIITDYERNNTILAHQAELDSFKLKSYDQCIIDRNRYKMESEKSPFSLKQSPSLIKIDDVPKCPRYKCLKRKSLKEWTFGINIPAFCRESRYDCSLCYKYIECSFLMN
ncbi:hypothetical protein ACTFIY_003522 [Dictyostelium cf. discoideum]